MLQDCDDEELILLECSSAKWFWFCSSFEREFYVHPVNRERNEFGEYYHLYKKIRNYPLRFFEYLRMEVKTFDYIKDLVSPRLQKNWSNFHSNPILQEERLVLTLRYLATGSSFKHLSFSFRMGASTVGKVVKETVEALWEVLQPLYMPIPTEEYFEAVAEDFYRMWQYPNCIGCIDGKHVRIIAPAHSGTMFYNYKHFFSVVLQAVVDSNYRFISIDVGGYGKQSDGGTFRTSSIYRMIEDNSLKLPSDKCLPSTNKQMPFVFLADDAYPLLKYVMKPYSNQNPVRNHVPSSLQQVVSGTGETT